MTTVQASEEGENENFSYGVCAMQGWRTEMVSFTVHMPAVLCGVLVFKVKTAHLCQGTLSLAMVMYAMTHHSVGKKRLSSITKFALSQKIKFMHSCGLDVRTGRCT